MFSNTFGVQSTPYYPQTSYGYPNYAPAYPNPEQIAGFERFHSWQLKKDAVGKLEYLRGLEQLENIERKPYKITTYARQEHIWRSKGRKITN